MKYYRGNFFSTVLILIPVVVEVQGLVGPEVVVRLEGRAVVVLIHWGGTVIGTSSHLGCGRAFWQAKISPHLCDCEYKTFKWIRNKLIIVQNEVFMISKHVGIKLLRFKPTGWCFCIIDLRIHHCNLFYTSL